MGIQAFLDDDTTAATSISLSAAAGSSSTATEVHVWLNKGVAGAAVPDVWLYPEVYDSDLSKWVASGHPALNGWLQCRLIGGVNTANDSRFVADASGATFKPVSPNQPFRLGTLYGNTARYVELKMTPPLPQGAATITWRLRIRSGVTTFLIDRDQPCGIVRGLCDSTRKEFILAPVITANGTPDDKVNGAFHSTNWNGLFKQRAVADSITLNQNDVASSALSSGQAYIVLISRSSDHTTALTATKGTKAAAASAVAPALPSGHLPVAKVVVNYHASASVINQSDITQYAVDGWFRVQAGTGLAATVGTGIAHMPGVAVEHGDTSSVALSSSSTNRLWLNADGSFSVVTTDDNPPRLGSEWIATATTDGSGVTAITDKRRFDDSPGQWYELQVAAGNEATGTAVTRKMIPYPHQVVASVAAVVTASSGATGSTKFDVNRKRAGASATVYTNQGGSTETRPTIAAQAYTDTASVPELTSDGNAGDVYSADVDTITSGGSRAADLSVSLLIYPRQ